MKFKIDENLPAEFAVVLGEAGFETATVGEEHLSGTTDSALLDRCRTEARVLVTLDLDFANVQAHPPGTHSGIIVFRSKSQDKLTLIALLKRIIPVLKRRRRKDNCGLSSRTASGIERREMSSECGAPTAWQCWWNTFADAHGDEDDSA